MINEQAMKQAIKAYETEMWQFIETLVNIDSGADAPEGVEKICHLVGEKLEPLGFKVTYLESAGPLQIVAERPRANKPKVFIFGHMDTVFAKGTAAARPFRMENGFAYGPGVMDMKGGIGLSVYTLKAMIENGYDEADLTVYFTGDEENNHPTSNSVEMMEKYAAGKDVAFLFEPGREDGSVVYGRKGAWRPIIQFKGIPTHSGNAYAEGASAIQEMAFKILDLFNLTRLEDGVTVNVGVVSGGNVVNIMAENAECKIDSRFKTIADAEKLQEQVKAICEHSYDPRTKTIYIKDIPGGFMPPYEVTPAGLKLLEFIKNEYRELGYGELPAQYVGGSSDAAYTTRIGVPSICGMGMQSVGAHTNNEYAFVNSYVPRAELFANCLLHIDKFLAAK